MADGKFDSWLKGQDKTTPQPEPSAPSGGKFDSWMQEEAKPKRSTYVPPTQQQEFGKRLPDIEKTIDQGWRKEQGQQARRQSPEYLQSMGLLPGTKAPPEAPLVDARAENARRQAEFEKKPFLQRTSERSYDNLAQGGGQLSKTARQTVGAGLGLVQGMASGDFTPVDLPAWRQFEETRNAELAAQQQGRPEGGFLTQVGEGILQAAGPAGAAGALGILTGGGTLGAMAVGGGMSAAGADWNNPGRAAAQTALGAVAPVVGGKVGQRIGGAVASRLARPVAQAAATAGGELIGGAAGNVIGSGAEQLGFERRLDTRELIKQGIIGAAMNVPGAIGAGRAARAPRITEPVAEAQPTTDLTGRFRGAIPLGQGTPPPSRKLLGPASTQMLPTEGLIPDVQETRQIPGVPRTIRAEDESTGRFQTDQIPVVAENAPTSEPPTRQMPPAAPPQRRTATLPRSTRQPELVPETPQRQQPKGVSTVEGLAPTNQPNVPRATPENIGELEGRYEQMLRSRYDKGAQLTGEMASEEQALGSEIYRYRNEEPKAVRGNRFNPDAEPGYTRQRPEPPMTPEEAGQRRAALQPRPRTSGLLQSSTPGRPVTQEVQIPSAVDPRTAFYSREDARRGHFDTLTDDELVAEIGRMQEVQNQAVGGRSKLSREQLEANRFDHRIAVGEQKERGRVQRAQGVEPGERIANRTPAQRAKKPQQTEPSQARTVEHPDPIINGKAVIAETQDGRVIVPNPENKSGVSVVKDRSQGPPVDRPVAMEAPGKPPTPRPQTQFEGAGAEYTGRKDKYKRQDVYEIEMTEGASKGQKRWVKEAPKAEAASSQPAGNQLVRKMLEIKPAARSGAPVNLAELRKQFPLNKEAFDTEIQKLAAADQIMLARHDAPGSLSQAERASLVKIGNDYFTAATIPEGKSHIMGMGLGSLQGMFEKPKTPPPGQQSLFEGPKRPGLSRKQISETAGGVQAVSQLGNPRFVIRNVLQHVAFGKQERAATRLAATLDWAYSKASGKPRQVMAPRGSDLAAYVRNWGKAVQAYKKGQPLPGKPNADYITADANKLDKGVGKVMTWINEIPDAANWQTRFDQSLQSIVRGAKSPDMNAAIDQAMMEANRASLRDENFASTAMQKIKQGLNSLSKPIFGTDKFGAGDFILKYAQTPGALLKRGLERSPLGLFQVAKEAATPGPFRRRNTLLALSRVAEGAATGVGLGAALGAAGVLVGPEEESRTGKTLEREEGVKGYSFNASALRRLLTGESTEMAEGDNLYSIDWLQPWAMNLSAGAALMNLHKDGKLGAKEGTKATGEAIYNSLAKTLDVMGDQSVLKNLSRYLGRAQGETFADKFLNFAKAVGLDVPGSFVPSMARQARQVGDPLERDTRPEQRGGFQSFMEEAGNRALAQLPGVSETFPTRPSLLTGEDKKTALGEMDTPARVAAQFSPANASTYTPRPVAREISRLNRAGENISISFPTAKKGELTSDLRKRERRFAETFSRMSKEMIADSFYKDADNETKAAAFAGLKRHLSGLGKEEFEEKGIDEIVEAAMEAVEKRRDKEEQ